MPLKSVQETNLCQAFLVTSPATNPGVFHPVKGAQACGNRKNMAAKSRSGGTQRVLQKLNKSIEDGEYYEAHQLIRTLYFR